jgi:mono/diheme cytochrome c family protein
MTVLAWLLILSLLLVFTMMVVASMADGREKSPVWVRSSLVAAAVIFLAAGVLMMREAGRGDGGIEAGVLAAQAQMVARPSPHDPWEGVGPPIAAEGRKLYVEAGCHRCHTIGAGTLVGPDLAEGVCKYDQAFLVRWILDTESVYAELGMESVNPGFPRMPATGVGPDQAQLIARYLESFPQPSS